MSRRAIIVEASKIKGCTELPGARADAARYFEFLRSEAGGAWQFDEIVMLSHPTKRALEAEITKAAAVDYSFIAFSGHGHHVRGQDIDETRVCINDTEEMAVNSLNPGNPRSIIIADACRNVTVQEPIRFAEDLREMAKAAHLNRDRCRRLFDEAVARAERGVIVMYSCDLNESAGESNRGGYFSRALTEYAMGWEDAQQREALLTTDSAFESAAVLTTKRQAQQHPQYQPGRRKVHFPFAVHA